MKELIPRDEYGIFCDNTDTMRIDSLYVAKVFGKEHRNVIRAIENLECSEDFRLLNFEQSFYKNEQNKKQPCYAMTRDGFSFLVMGFTGKKAARFKEAYINRFNEMEQHIRSMIETREMFPKLTDTIKRVHEDPKPYHFSNEADMINRLVTGMSAKQYREAHGIPKGESIRPYLTETQLREMSHLQDIDVGLIIGVPEFAKRKEILTRELETMRRK